MHRTERKARYSDGQVGESNLRQSNVQWSGRMLRQVSCDAWYSPTDALHFPVTVFISAPKSFRLRPSAVQYLEPRWGGGGLLALLKYKEKQDRIKTLKRTKGNKSTSQKCVTRDGFQRQKSYLFTAAKPFFTCHVTLENMMEPLTCWN